ncbi:hypothetical protein [Chenggangzhangella methanolivorans]|uniref:Uncharacterized protein n=1 Tax=Chenggangzhangella methanolivorans TaxID=1437009 RepID=A0A9E6UNE2_9HYPH|nr:hypothetical protein [Chenggangzhangella methanolivorans]QZN98429.1 hypothetical protein K6K41_15210 [Chenggangzhangella methanolivorans]
MASDASSKSNRTAETQAREAERRKRLAAALRDNLKRRKAPGAEPPAAADEPKT